MFILFSSDAAHRPDPALDACSGSTRVPMQPFGHPIHPQHGTDVLRLPQPIPTAAHACNRPHHLEDSMNR